MGLTETFDFGASNLRVEHAVVTFSATHAKRGDLAVKLISPQGTESPLIEFHGDGLGTGVTWNPIGHVCRKPR